VRWTCPCGWASKYRSMSRSRSGRREGRRGRRGGESSKSGIGAVGSSRTHWWGSGCRSPSVAGIGRVWVGGKVPCSYGKVDVTVKVDAQCSSVRRVRSSVG
jgi:hypothetical protein